MLKKTRRIVIATIDSFMLIAPMTTLAAGSYTVVPGDTMWKIAVKTQTGIDELINANTQLQNPNLIYPGQKIEVPYNDEYSVEQEVIRLVNVERANAGLPALKYD